jgi:hypothetical protein
MTDFTSTEFVSGIERISSAMNMGGCYQRQQSFSILNVVLTFHIPTKVLHNKNSTP